MTNTEKGRLLRARRIAKCLCVACGLVPPKPYRLRCHACIWEDSDRKAKWRLERREAQR